MEEAQLSAITSRLDAILRIMLDSQRKSEGVKLGDQLLVLKGAGLSQTEAGRVLGVKSNQVPSYIRNAGNKKPKLKIAVKSMVSK